MLRQIRVQFFSDSVFIPGGMYDHFVLITPACFQPLTDLSNWYYVYTGLATSGRCPFKCWWLPWVETLTLTIHGMSKSILRSHMPIVSFTVRSFQLQNARHSNSTVWPWSHCLKWAVSSERLSVMDSVLSIYTYTLFWFRITQLFLKKCEHA